MADLDSAEVAELRGVVLTKLDSIASDIQQLKKSLTNLPCLHHAELLAKHSAMLAAVWVLVVLVMGGLLGLAWRTINR